MNVSVRFSPEALQHLDDIEAYIAEAGSPAAGERYVDAIVEHCAGLAAFPMIGVARDDLFPGLRITHFRKRAVIAYLPRDGEVIVIGVFYGGRRIDGLSVAPDDDV